MKLGTYFRYVFADGDTCICKVTDTTTITKFKIAHNFDSERVGNVEYDVPRESSIEEVYSSTSMEEIRKLHPEEFV